MCRLVAVIASEITEFGLVLREAPRSLARLSNEHPDGWGVAAFGGEAYSIPPPPPDGELRHELGWRVHKGTERAAACGHFHTLASRSRGTVLIAHIRQKTVGPTSVENTHPFAQDGWVFAHNGTIKDQAWVRRGVAPERLATIRGQTDSEELFAFLLTRLDEAGASAIGADVARREAATRVLADATAELRARNVGAFNFVLSNGSSCFVHRFGRSLYLLERGLQSAPSLEPPQSAWRERRRAVLVASERLTDEPWSEVEDGTFLRIDRDPMPAVYAPAPSERAAS